MVGSSVSESAFTFHYASTLSIAGMKEWSIDNEFTFHYASTLSDTIVAVGFVFSIYIPLCFYFIGGVCPHPGPSRVHLHSTMLLLYIDTFPGQRSHDKIYIPLCFYFIDQGVGGIVGDEQFTFHYASTLFTFLLFVSRFSVFTFHYASTL